MTRELLKDVLMLLNEVCIENALECLNEAQRLYSESFRKYNIDNAELDLQSIKNMIARIETEPSKPEPEPKPVAYLYKWDDGGEIGLFKNRLLDLADRSDCLEFPLYTSPTPRKPLTVDEITDDVCKKILGWTVVEQLAIKFARAVEKAHGIE